MADLSNKPISYTGPHPLESAYRDVLARAEAAEAARNTAARRAFNAEADNQRLTAENRRLAARVAELEVELAAQEWRPVTEKPEPDQEVEIVIEATFDDYGPGGWTSYGYYFAADYPTGWRPLPPAPQETTP